MHCVRATGPRRSRCRSCLRWCTTASSNPFVRSSARCPSVARVRHTRAWSRGHSNGPSGRPDRRPGNSRGRRARASRTPRARRRRDRRSTAGGLEQIEQAYLALGSVELVLLVHGQPRHPAAFGGQRVTGVGQVLLLHEELLARSLPTPAATRSGVCSSRDAPSRVPCLSSCLLPSVSSSSFRLSLDMTDIWRLHIHNDGGSNETGVTSVAGFVNLQPRPILSKKL